MTEYIDKDKLLKYLEDTIIFSGKTDSPYLNGQVKRVCFLADDFPTVTENDFCSRGARKE